MYSEMRQILRLICLIVLLQMGCRQQSVPSALRVAASQSGNSSAQAQTSDADPLAPIIKPRTTAEKIVNGAKAEARRGVLYDASYKRIAYPNGDVAPDRGACTDVLIRALRHAGIDLQQRVHEDMKAH